MQLSKTIVVCGVSHKPGLGYAIARRFAAGGYKVGIIGRTESRLSAICEAIHADVAGSDVKYVVADATDAAQCASGFAELAEQQGRPEVLVYNLATRPAPAAIADLAPAVLEADMRAGAYGGLLCAQAVLPAMLESQKGAIIFTGASASLRGSANFGGFAVQKCGLRALAQSLAKEVLPKGVHVAHVIVDALVDMPFIETFLPGASKGRLIDTDMAADVYWMLSQQDLRCCTFEMDLRPLEATMA
ncbi:short-chain dehydrogenase/reductase SDR [Pelagophyceae sp. CCMP2097]|nr:short-chain dehydrogenase/reductase SDR [Pelagophyceae sp. CCMP2097]|mmetsp:Transcript_9382/g.31021  ORF Transcript_9382/g.31021 Transcript_9382/m.31021 type:complete len:245 (+) Transcript_9382:66-800(+)